MWSLGVMGMGAGGLRKFFRRRRRRRRRPPPKIGFGWKSMKYVENGKYALSKNWGSFFGEKKSPCGNTAASTQLLKITKYHYFIQYVIILYNIPSIIKHNLAKIRIFYQKNANMHFWNFGGHFSAKKSPCGNTAASTQLLKIIKYSRISIIKYKIS